MLTKMIDGKEIICSEDEEKLILEFWEINKNHPEYMGHLSFNGITPAFHDMVECKKHHQYLIQKASESAIKEINELIEKAQEDGEDDLLKELYAKRKEIKQACEIDIAQCKTVDELKKTIPACISNHWNKQ